MGCPMIKDGWMVGTGGLKWKDGLVRWLKGHKVAGFEIWIVWMDILVYGYGLGKMEKAEEDRERCGSTLGCVHTTLGLRIQIGESFNGFKGLGFSEDFRGSRRRKRINGREREIIVWPRTKQQRRKL